MEAYERKQYYKHNFWNFKYLFWHFFLLTWGHVELKGSDDISAGSKHVIVMCVDAS